ncbi:2-oxoisovalerate dehydrogenase E1 component [Ardenticatena maritima]|uniref:2-oxoisovalerate dehydrogenase E1 component n=1 Tax=Ardenticatena maritima TaxID=872965 RepID=A0A0M9UBK4_9CHLR|nr:dehydrogenase E1 component subunit alpha/beta [Ardenticatena maritima]KPL88322.1 hypothetical protein SE16_05695 [Ardenticatena maritima]GAP61937.1 2-oxoisovalerate dehydrogenase E1 component [Ardenticatena maritima]
MTLLQEDALQMYTYMLKMRMIEERASALYREANSPIVGRIYTGRGQEAISVGAAYALEKDDVIAPLYRDLGANLVRGITTREVFCQYMGRANSHNRGKDSGIHFGDRERGIVSMVSNLTASVPVATGVALGFVYRQEPRVVMTFFGDGSTAHGSWHEGVNMAAAQRLPVVFVLENNQWALSTPTHKHTALRELADRAKGYGMPGVRVDGNDVLAVYEAAREAVARARAGEGPTLIEAVTMRMEGHSITDPAQYVPREMLEEWAARDPIARFEAFLREQGWLDDETAARIRREIADEIEEAVQFALNSPEPRPEEALTDVFAPANVPEVRPPASAARSTMSYRAAIRDAIFTAFARDERVFLMGEDVSYGGVYGISKDLAETFGERRVIDTPIAEAAIVGAATGAALFGLRPIAEIQFADFIAPAMDILVNMTAKYHYRTRWPVPLVIRTPAGAIIESHGSTGPFHSQSPEAWFAHTPGLKIVVPSTPYDAKGLLLAALEDPNPVLYFEQKALYNLRGEVPEGYYTVPLGKAAVRREGDDLSIITYGALVAEALKAAEMLAAEGISVEVLDLRTLVPLDEEAVLATVRKTGKVLVAYEANMTCGFGAEVATRIWEHAFEWLDAPLVRVSAPDTPTPSAPQLARFWYPDAGKIAAAARDLAAY